MSFKLSVCISVHNTGKYLSRCLDSLVCQTLEEMEIVIVNNGSTDNSESIMKDYQIQYPERNIKVITQEDRGLAQGRRTGVNNAGGKYIAFLDADDYVSKDAYKTLVDYAEINNVDIVEMESIRGNKLLSSPYTGIKDSHDVLREYFLSKTGIYPMIWMRIYSKHLFGVPVFPEIYVNNEDVFAFPCLMHNANSIGYVKECLHVYSIDNENAEMIEVSKKDHSKKLLENRKRWIKCIGHIECYIGRDIINNEYQIEFQSFKQLICRQFIFSDFTNYPFEERVEYIKNEFAFSSESDVLRFLKKYAYTKYSLTNRLIKVLGVKNVFRLIQLKTIVGKGI